MNLQDKVVLITGSRRIGVAVAGALAENGAHISLSYRHSENDLAHTLENVREHNRQAVMIQADLSDPAACRRLVDTTVTKLGRLDALINMASNYVEKSFKELTDSDLDVALDVDLKAAYVCTLAAVPHLRASGGGHIINFSDWVASSGRPRYQGFLPYYVAKCAILGLTEATALELAGDGIFVNAIAPGPIRRPSGMGETEAMQVVQATPLGRWGGDQAVADAVLGLLRSNFVTGETIRVDGGRHLR